MIHTVRCPECGAKLDEQRTVSWGGYVFDEVECSFLEPVRAHLSPRFQPIVSRLIRAAGQPVPREHLHVGLEQSAGHELSEKNLDVYVCQLRKRAPFFRIVTLTRIGVKLEKANVLEAAA